MISAPKARFKDWSKALRLPQCLKSLLIFVPLLAGHQVFNPGLVRDGLSALFLLWLCASSVYIVVMDNLPASCSDANGECAQAEPGRCACAVLR